MKKLIALSIVAVFALAGVAYAADAAAPAPSKAAAPAAKAPAAKAPAGDKQPGVKATVTGKVESKMVDRKGKQVKMYSITVAEAKGADGKAMDDLKGKSLHLGPRDKVAEIEKFDGKNAEVTGSVREGRRPGMKFLQVESIK